jgi:hypothetical protein
MAANMPHFEKRELNDSEHKGFTVHCIYKLDVHCTTPSK